MIEFIAEIGNNHNGDFERCRRLIRAAAGAGCAGVQFPLFRVDQRYAPQVLKVSARHRLERRSELPLHFVPGLRACAHEHGLKFGLTPGDPAAVDASEAHADFFKVSSWELPWLDLVLRCADTGLPLLLGTGMADASEAWNAIQTALEAGCSELTMLHSVSRHPVAPDDCNLAAIGTLRELLEREFRPLFGDATLKAGWSDHSVSTRVIARAVNHWACDTVEFHLDLDGQGLDSGRGHCWLPDRIAEVIAGGYLPVQRDSDGTGRIAPDAAETAVRPWRADPHDGLRPIRELRRTWPPTQPEAVRRGPDVYLVPDGLGLGHLARCLALAESLRDDHDADILFLIRGTPPQIQLLTRNGFNWVKFESMTNLVTQIAFLDKITADTGPSVCVLDLQDPADLVVSDLRRSGLLAVVIDQPDAREMDLGIVPSFGWTNAANRRELVGGTEYLLVREDITVLREHHAGGSLPGAAPRIVVSFGGADPNDLTTRTAAALHAVRPRAEVQVVLFPATDRYHLISQILASRFPDYEIIGTGDALEPILAGADLVVTALGVTAFEALCLGVPVLMLTNYPHDAEPVARLVASGAVVALGRHDELTDAELTDAVRAVFSDPDRLSQLRFAARELAAGPLDGHGASRAADRICELMQRRRGNG